MAEPKMEDINMMELSGWLKIKHEDNGTWHRRFVVLHENTFSYYRDQNRIDLVFKAPLIPSCRCEEIKDSKIPRFILSIPGHQNLSFACESQKDCTKWVNCLRSLFTNNQELTMNSFRIISVIGRGYFGKVMLVQSKSTGDYYAIKSVQKRRILEAKMSHTIIAERNILMKTSNPFIIRLCFSFQTPSKFYLGLEYGAGGELFYLMDRVGCLPIQCVRLYAAEIAIALNYLHSMGIIYRDLKPENILLDAEGHIKLTDFGLSKSVIESPTTSANTFCGTIEYLAPEMIQKQPYSYGVDWWALGILTYEMLTETTPFMDDNRSTIMHMITHNPIEFPEGLPPDAIEFISALLTKDSKKRPDFEQISKMDFFKPFDWDKVYNKEYQPYYVPDSRNLDNPSNFDPEFTEELPVDSPAPSTSSDFPEFSYNGSILEDSLITTEEK